MSRVDGISIRLSVRRSEFDASESNDDVNGQLLALDGVLDYFYRLREHYRDNFPDGGPRGYDASARTRSDGRITEAIVMLRGKLSHVLLSDVEPKRSHLFPSNNLYLGQNTFMGEVLRWPSPAKVLQEHPEVLNHSAWSFYEAEVGQVPVRITLDIVQSFLLATADS